MLEFIKYKLRLQVADDVLLSYDCDYSSVKDFLHLISDYITSNKIKDYNFLVNDDTFDHIPNLDEILCIKGENPALLPKLLKLLKKYDTIKAIGFDFHDYNHCNTYGVISVYGTEGDEKSAYALCKELEDIYNIGIDTYYPECTLISTICCGIDENDWMLWKGVDW